MGDNDGPKWYISRKEIEENSPSRRDGIDLKKETYFRKSYCTFLQELGMELKVPQLTIATAIVMCHRFYFHQSHAKNDRKTIATVCMFIAGKVEETPRLLKDVIVVSHSILHKKDPAAMQKIKQKELYEEQKELILLGERLVLMTLGFDLNIIHPYKDLMEAIRKFKDPPKFLAKVAWNFVNDGLRTSLCLQFSPRHIAAGAIFLGAKFVKVKLLTEGERVWWQEFGIAPGQLEDVSNQLLELYEQTSREGGMVNAHQSNDNWSAGGRSEVWDQSVGTEASVKCSNSSMEEHPVGNDEGKSVNMKESMDGSLTTTVSDDARSYGHGGNAVARIKAAVEKKRKSGAVIAKKMEFMDDDDLIERELESGVELGARKNQRC